MNNESLRQFILDKADIGIRAIDENGIIIYCNDMMAKIMNVKLNDMVGRNILDFQESYDNNSSTIFNCLRYGKEIHNKVKINFNQNGKIQYIVSTNIPVKDNGIIVGVVEYIKTENTYNELLKFINSNTLSESKESNIKRKTYYDFDDFLTIEKKIIELINYIKHVSLYNYNVLIFGETGTGKEIIAQSIHNRSNRRNKAFVAQNCAAIPENLLESIFFGTVTGCFTGATDSPGLFELSNGGTLLLDELNSLPIYLQSKLLRVLQEGRIRRIGGKKDISVDVRVISTTNEKTDILIKENRLREDLYYRLGPIYIDIPPLRNRKADIDYLTRIFIKRESKMIKVREPQLSIKVKDFFRDYSWRGNVRELKNVISGILLNTSCKNIVEIEHLPNYMFEKGKFDISDLKVDFENLSYQEKIFRFEKELIEDALLSTKGNVSEASKILGLKRQTLQYKIKIMNIQ